MEEEEEEVNPEGGMVEEEDGDEATVGEVEVLMEGDVGISEEALEVRVETGEEEEVVEISEEVFGVEEQHHTPHSEVIMRRKTTT